MQTLFEDLEGGSEGRRQTESTVRTAIGELTAFDAMQAIAVFNRQRVMIHRQLSLSREAGHGLGNVSRAWLFQLELARAIVS
jgi:hypothetical protein